MRFFGLAIALILTGCAAPGESVRLSDAARGVHVLKDMAVGCDEIGPIEVTAGGSVLGMRSRGDYETAVIEAREEASRMGGDSLVVDSSEYYDATGEHHLLGRVFKCR